MRNITEYSLYEWAQLRPLSDYAKEKRNNVLNQRYLQRTPPALETFRQEIRSLTGSNVVALIAFEQPLALDWALTMAERNLKDCSVLVFDNSRRDTLRLEIEGVCKDHGVPYLPLPKNPVKHPNRSHGMALNWVYWRIIRELRPKRFGFVDHDMIPLMPIDIEERLGNQPCFGAENSGKFGWNLWAGYCFFDFASVHDKQLDFLYDFSRGLDTGGRNWPSLYRNLIREELRFAPRKVMPLRDPISGEQRRVQIVDDRWMHIGSISYNDNFRQKRVFFGNLLEYLLNGGDWSQLVSSKTE